MIAQPRAEIGKIKQESRYMTVSEAAPQNIFDVGKTAVSDHKIHFGLVFQGSDRGGRTQRFSMKPQLLYPRISFSCIFHDIRQVPAFPDAIGRKSFLIFSMAPKIIYDAVEPHVEVHFCVLQRTAPIICIAVGYDHVSVRGGWAFQ